MKFKIFLMLFILFSINIINSSINIKFNDSIKYYNNSDYKNALSYYLDILKSGYDNFEINYNIGCCYYKLNEIGKARFYFERSLIYKPFDSDLNHNLKVIYNKLVKNQDNNEQIIINSRILYLIPINVVILINIILSIIAVILLTLLYNFYSYRKLILIFLATVIFFILIFTFYNIFQYKNIKDQKLIITKKNANVYLTPNENETIILTLEEGYSNKVYGELNYFIKTKFNDGLTGWIKKEDLIYKP
ncbi:MAG: tetratricopeptide repeat protein [Spirochaetes bacterium]|nr:tetratricopeptide repeat protein [Spirochaetota bacterium]